MWGNHTSGVVQNYISNLIVSPSCLLSLEEALAQSITPTLP
jgi:hypothetical protein